MFGGKQANPYDEIVNKTTDENLTSENWELILNLCDKVNDEGEQGARNVIAAVLKRLAHRNPNVQLYALALGEALSKNCGAELHREMASRSFTQALEKLVTDRTTHEKVKRRALYLVSLWTGEFENNPQLGLMEELYNTLKAKNFKFDQITEPPPPDVDDEVRRKEEEELQRVLEMSVHDKGGRNLGAWKDTTTISAGGSRAAASTSNTSLPGPGPSSSGGYTPTDPPRSAYPDSETHHRGSISTSQPPTPAATSAITQPPSATRPEQSASSAITTTMPNAVTRVRALHTFEPTVAGELAFEKGDIIKVTDRAYDNWWRGQLRGRTGIFPVNYVEPLPDLTPSDLAREAEQEATVFSQAANIDKLINMLRGLDPAKDNLADNEEIQELYRSSMSLRPKIVKLIDKYSQKRAELVAMNENFVKARGVFEEMMEESLARHTGVYDNAQPTFRQARPDSRANRADYRASTYGWNPSVYDQPGYNAYPAAPTAYAGEQAQQPPGQHPYQGQSYGDPNAYSVHHQPSVYAGQVQPQGPQPYPPVDSGAYGQQPPPQAQSQPPPGQGQPPQGHSQPPPPQGQGQPAQQHQPYGQSHVPTDPAAYAQQNPQVQAVQPQSSPQSQPPGQAQTHQSQGQSQPQQQQGPPYVYDPNIQYADPNVQAWAQYYAQGGKDTAGAVYFVSVPGVTDLPGAAAQPQPQGQSPPTTSQAPVEPSAGSPPATAQTHQAQTPGPYQAYGSAPPQASPPAEHAQHPHLHIQPGYQSANSTTALGSTPGPTSAAPSTAPHGANTPQSYHPSGYAPQHDVRVVASPTHEAHHGYGQAPPSSGTQQPPVAADGVGA